jgi:hypothetical protein
MTAMLRRFRAVPLLAITATMLIACSDDDSTAEGSEDLILDYTLYVEGGVQVSGLDVSPAGTTLALVTDLEKMLLYDLEQQAVTSEFSVAFGDLPRQGSTEAVAFTSSDELAVLYPDADLVRRYDLAGHVLGEMNVNRPGSDLAGAMTATDDGSLLLATVSPNPALVWARTAQSVELIAEDEIGEIVGLSMADADSVYIGTEDGEVLLADVASGHVQDIATITDVGELSDVEFFVNPEDEPVIAMTDDADEYNGTEGPIRLYLAP